MELSNKDLEKLIKLLRESDDNENVMAENKENTETKEEKKAETSVVEEIYSAITVNPDGAFYVSDITMTYDQSDQSNTCMSFMVELANNNRWARNIFPVLTYYIPVLCLSIEERVGVKARVILADPVSLTSHRTIDNDYATDFIAYLESNRDIKYLVSITKGTEPGILAAKHYIIPCEGFITNVNQENKYITDAWAADWELRAVDSKLNVLPSIFSKGMTESAPYAHNYIEIFNMSPSYIPTSEVFDIDKIFEEYVIGTSTYKEDESVHY